MVTAPAGAAVGDDICRYSAKSGFDSMSSFLTCLAMMILLSPQVGHGRTSWRVSPNSIALLRMLSIMARLRRGDGVGCGARGGS